MKGIVILLGLAYLAGGAYASYRVYRAVYDAEMKSVSIIPGGGQFFSSSISSEAILSAIATMIGILAIPIGIAYYTFLYKVYQRDGMWGLLPFLAVERLLV